MSQKIYICDFNDSFTYNILSVLKEINSQVNIEVIPFGRLLNFFQVIQSEEDQIVLILGPGPGHPQDYQHLYSSISKLIQKDNIFVMGICLGHQIIWEINGAQTDYCGTPVHGHEANYRLNLNLSDALGISREISVQRYNSLATKLSPEQIESLTNKGWQLLTEDNELIISYLKNIITYQFHPESIGTTCPKAFFRPVFQFLL